MIRKSLLALFILLIASTGFDRAEASLDSPKVSANPNDSLIMNISTTLTSIIAADVDMGIEPDGMRWLRCKD